MNKRMNPFNGHSGHNCVYHYADSVVFYFWLCGVMYG